MIVEFTRTSEEGRESSRCWWSLLYTGLLLLFGSEWMIKQRSILAWLDTGKQREFRVESCCIDLDGGIVVNEYRLLISSHQLQALSR